MGLLRFELSVLCSFLSQMEELDKFNALQSVFESDRKVFHI